MIVDPSLPGLVATIAGNEIYISKELYDHPSVLITNSMEHQSELAENPRNEYDPEIFSTLAYLVCQNYITFQIVDNVDQPIYIRYRSEFETFYSSVVNVNLAESAEAEIVEEIESLGALNCVVNYNLAESSRLALTTFYQNNSAASSVFYRKVTILEFSDYAHVLMGKGSTNSIDENKVTLHQNANAKLIGIVNSANRKFHTIMYINPVSEKYSVSIDYKLILRGKSGVSFFPKVLGQMPAEHTQIHASYIKITGELDEDKKTELKKDLSGILDMAILSSMIGVKRFYNNKTKFLHFS
jgi:hypothetical protein